MTRHRCKLDALAFTGALGAPGFGLMYECPDCGATYWRSSSCSDPIPTTELSPEDVTLQPWEVV